MPLVYTVLLQILKYQIYFLGMENLEFQRSPTGLELSDSLSDINTEIRVVLEIMKAEDRKPTTGLFLLHWRLPSPWSLLSGALGLSDLPFIKIYFQICVCSEEQRKQVRRLEPSTVRTPVFLGGFLSRGRVRAWPQGVGQWAISNPLYLPTQDDHLRELWHTKADLMLTV